MADIEDNRSRLHYASSKAHGTELWSNPLCWTGCLEQFPGLSTD